MLIVNCDCWNMVKKLFYQEKEIYVWMLSKDKLMNTVLLWNKCHNVFAIDLKYDDFIILHYLVGGDSISVFFN